MSEPQAYLNGRWLPAGQLAIGIDDAGFVLGTTITEQLRTFRGQLFCPDEHLRRLFHSLEIIRVDPGLSPAELAEIAREAVALNHPLLEPGDDLGLGIFVTPGTYRALAEGRRSSPTVCVHTYRLAFGLWAEKYLRGESVVVSQVEQISPRSWPPELKCRSRMHYFLADRRADEIEPGSRAVLLDRDGFVSESTTANVVLYREAEGLVSPPRGKILPGISLMALARLARGLGIPLVERDVRPEELCAADELFLTSTSVCVLPVVRCNGRNVGDGKPGEVYARLLAAWSDEVGVDVAEQARRFAVR